MLTVSRVRAGYRGTVVLDDVEFAAGGDGALVTALLGPSGCGKSTLLRVIAGLEPVQRGTVAFDGEDLARVPPHRRDIGLVFQDGQLFAGKTVGQNIAYGLRRRGVSRRDAAARVEELLDLIRLPGMADRRVTELSGGQAQRVALARALAPSPRLLLLDEPLAALDAALREELAYTIVELVTASAIPTVVVTHDHTEAALMADRVSVMLDGAIVQTATPAQLWRHPADERVARFLGATTVLAGHAAGGIVTLPIGAAALAVPDGPCRIALRRDSVVAEEVGEISAAAAGEATAAGPGTGVARVRSARPLPDAWWVRVELDGGLRVDAVAATAVSPGDRVTLRPVPERLGVVGR